MTSFIIMALLLNIIPGPALVYLVCQTMRNGLFAGFMTLFGIELGTLCYLFAVLMGLSLFIDPSKGMYLFFQLAGALFFVLFGMISLLRHAPADALLASNESNKRLLTHIKFKQCYKGLCINLFNPKMLLFYLILLPSLLNPELDDVAHQMICYGGLFALISMFVHLILVGLATWGRQRWLIHNAKQTSILLWMQSTTSLVFIVCGISIFYMVVKRL